MGSIYGTGKKGKATKMHAELVRARGACERCGRTDAPVQCAHIVRRRYNATRVDPTNAWCLCVACHFRTEQHADDFMALVTDTIGLDAYFELKRRAEAGCKANDQFWQEWIDLLTPMLREAA